jgi:hypothetical protein
MTKFLPLIESISRVIRETNISIISYGCKFFRNKNFGSQIDEIINLLRMDRLVTQKLFFLGNRVVVKSSIWSFGCHCEEH